jgi:hypothetical protein
MSTHSTIAKVYPDGTVKAISCHFDGYFSYMGPMLSTHYNDEEKIDYLLTKGRLLSLKPNIDPIPVDDYAYGLPPKGKEKITADEHCDETPQKNTCVIYHRDHYRHDPLEIFNYPSLDAWANSKDLEGYDYVRKDGKWYVMDVETKVLITFDDYEAAGGDNW